jgi:flagellar assembly factor FliW
MSAAIDGSIRSVPPEQSMSAVSAPSPAVSAAPVRTIASRVLGDTVVSPEHLFHFPEGLHGFEQHQEYVLVPAPREGFWWLQSAEEPGLAFLLTDPFRAYSGYEVDLGVGDTTFLEIERADDTLVLTVVTLPANRQGQATTNLRGPLVLNVRNRKGRQVVSRDDRHECTAPLTL